MLGSSVRRVSWALAFAASVGLVVGVSSARAQAQIKNPGDPLSLGVGNLIDETTQLSGFPGSGNYELLVQTFGSGAIAVGAEASGDGTALFGGSPAGFGVEGASGLETGVFGHSGSGSGVFGESQYSYGVRGSSHGTRPGVFGSSDGGAGVFGYHIGPDGIAAGVEGDTASSAKGAVGVLGRVNSTTAGFGSAGVKGDNASTRDGASGVLGQVTSTAAGSISAGVRGINNSAGATGYGVYGSQYGSGAGVFGNSPSGRGVYGFSGGGVGVYGASSAGVAGFFDGNVTVNGDLIVISGHVKAFRIDDPLDPEHKYLVHASVESNQVLNIYSGNITTDRNGFATVRLPAYFDRINTDLRYQLTAIGQFAQAIIAKKEAGNQFLIRTSKPHVEVSWQVTARRNDAYLRAHPFHELQNKTKFDKNLGAHR